MENWQKCTLQQKALVIKAFLDVCGEDATREQWLAFLNRYQDVKGFEWTKLVD